MRRVGTTSCQQSTARRHPDVRLSPVNQADAASRPGSTLSALGPTRRVVVDARNARMGGAMAFIEELVPRLERCLGPDTRLDVVVGPPGSLRERVQRALLFNAADAILHSGNRGGLCVAPIRVVCVRDRLLLPGAHVGSGLSVRLVLRRVALAMALARATHVVVPSRSMLDPLRRVLRVVRPFVQPPVRVVRHGRPSWVPCASPARTGPIRLLFPSHVGPHKNFTLLARVMEDPSVARRFALTLTADSSELVGDLCLRDLFARAGAAVEFTGPVPRSSLEALYGAHDAVVFPSLAESFGQPLVEAMTMGLPVVAADRAWAREVCEDAALFADPSDPAAWIAALNDLSTHIADLRERGRSRAEAFSWERAAEDYAQLLR